MEQKKARIRDAVMETFRNWGGQWNVSPHPPDDGERADAWLIRVHSHPFVHGAVTVETVEAYLKNPADRAAAARWETELRSLFDAARAEAG